MARKNAELKALEADRKGEVGDPHPGHGRKKRGRKKTKRKMGFRK